jgi:DNA-binding response OmpR family regulator
LNLNIGYCSNIDRNFLSGTDIIEQAVKNKKLAEEKNKRVLIMESDEDFALLLEETLVREGNEARVSSGANNLIKEIEEFMPRTLIIEASKLDGAQSFVPLCQKLQRYKDEFGLQILVATNVSGYQNFLANGADVYIPKPYELETLLKEVRRLRYTHV